MPDVWRPSIRPRLNPLVTHVEAHHTIRLDADAYARFLAVLDAPARPVPELLEQLRKIEPLKHLG